MTIEKQLLSIINSTRTLTSTLDLDEVLNRLIKEVQNIINGSDAIVLFIYNDKKQKLIAKSSFGFNLVNLDKIQLKPNEGMSGKTFIAKKPIIYYSANDTEKGMSDLLSENIHNYHNAVGYNYYPFSAICVPLLSKGNCIGVLTIDSYTKNVLFTNRDLELLETFAAQAIIAIENARLFSQNKRSHHINQELSKISLSHEGLEEMVQALSGLIKKEVCISNEFFDIIAYSSPSAKSNFNITVTKHGQELNKITKTILDKPMEIHQSAILFPINNTNFLIGLLYIFVRENEEMDPLDLFAIEQVKNVFAIEMMNEERDTINKIKHKGIILERILAKDENHPSVQSFFDKNKKYYCKYIIVTLSLNSPREWSHEANKRSLIEKMIYRDIHFFQYDCLTYEKNEQFIFLFHTTKNNTNEQFTNDVYNVFSSIINHAEKELDYRFLKVGIGNVFTNYSKAYISYDESEKCIDYLHLISTDKSIYTFTDLGIYYLFIKQEPADLQKFVHKEIEPLMDSTELIDTLRIFLESGQNLSKTAKLSYLHINTIKYRINKVKKLLDYQDSQDFNFFRIQLAIYINDYLIKLNHTYYK